MIYMKVLGIESTSHTIGIGIYDSEKGILANSYATNIPSAGYIPRELVEHHQRNFELVLKKALSESKLNLNDIDVIAVANGPGIGTTLKFGVSLAKYLSSKYNKPIVGVNHCFAHIKIAEFESEIKKDYIAIFTSGGNTQILHSEDGFNFQVLGETLDIGIGNLFDNFARKLDIFPANGASLEKIASKGKYIKLPYTVKGMNMAFSGLLTSAEKALEKNKKEDVAFSLMQNSFSMVLETAQRAFYLKNAKSFIVCGGVAQNSMFKNMLNIMAKESKAKIGIPRNEYNRDNGAMIAYTGFLIAKKYGMKKPKEINAVQNYRIEDLEKFCS